MKGREGDKQVMRKGRMRGVKVKVRMITLTYMINNGQTVLPHVFLIHLRVNTLPGKVTQHNPLPTCALASSIMLLLFISVDVRGGNGP